MSEIIKSLFIATSSFMWPKPKSSGIETVVSLKNKYKTFLTGMENGKSQTSYPAAFPLCADVTLFFLQRLLHNILPSLYCQFVFVWEVDK